MDGGLGMPSRLSKYVSKQDPGGGGGGLDLRNGACTVVQSSHKTCLVK